MTPRFIYYLTDGSAYLTQGLPVLRDRQEGITLTPRSTFNVWYWRISDLNGRFLGTLLRYGVFNRRIEVRVDGLTRVMERDRNKIVEPIPYFFTDMNVHPKIRTTVLTVKSKNDNEVTGQAHSESRNAFAPRSHQR